MRSPFTPTSASEWRSFFFAGAEKEREHRPEPPTMDMPFLPRQEAKKQRI